MEFSFFREDAIVPSMQDFLLAWGVVVWFFVLFCLIKFGARFLLARLGKWPSLKKDFLVILSGLSWYSGISVALFCGNLFLPFVKWIHVVFSGFFAVALIIELSGILKFFLKVVMEKGFAHQDTKTKKNLTEILNTLLQILIWILAALIFFDTVGVAITPLLASLGVWGIAVAFASQKLIEDFFSSFSIMGSSPCRIGDIITIKDTTGTVKKIGLRSTTLLTVEDKSVIIPNRLLVAEIIENSGTIKVRRKRFSLTITYETPLEKVRQIPRLLEQIIGKHKDVGFEWAVLRDLQASCLEIYVSYVINNDDWLNATQLHSKILEEILEKFAEEKIDFAYPTQTLRLKK